ncbi:hypothetical protein ACP70R_030787 [Stipagrostis hirtigluma subsp. patula]
MAGEAASSISNPFAPLTNLPPPPSQGQGQGQEHPLPPPAKKKRNLPGTPDPDAEVIALSPRTLLATNRFVCEICGKGFQRDQNLQLHRRGHNLPWKLRQRSGKEPRKRVYVCPEKSCVHHNPSRALGDLTGIKKHFCRKHGEKKWKCDKCNKRYAVQSDWKAHSKTCGTREYRCDCGTLFSRRDSFITHRAFCDALAEETARLNAAAASSSAATSHHLFAATTGPGLNINMMLPPPAPAPAHHLNKLLADHAGGALSLWGSDALPSSIIGGVPVPPQLYADLFAPTNNGAAPPQFDAAQLGWLYGHGKLASSNASELTSASPAGNNKQSDSVPSVFSGQQHAKPAAPTDMSATALLQKAAQIGAVTSGAAMPLVGAPFEPAKSGGAQAEECNKFDGAAHLFGASQQNGSLVGSTMSELTAATASVPYDVLSVVRHAHAGLKDAVGREETRDFLGVGVQALCSPSLHGWI